MESDVAHPFTSTQDERVQALERFASYYCTELENLDNAFLIGGRAAISALQEFEAIEDNILGAQAVAAARMSNNSRFARLAADIPNAGAYITSFRLPASHRKSWVQAQLQAASLLNDGRIGVMALGNFGNIYEQMGNFEKSLSCHQLALKLATKGGDSESQRVSRANIGMILARLHRFEEALPFLEQSVEEARTLNKDRMVANALCNLSAALNDHGQYMLSLSKSKQALKIARALKDRRLEGNALANKAAANVGLGKLRRARACQNARLAIAKELGDRRGTMMAHGMLAQVDLLQHRWTDAARNLSIQIAEAQLLADAAAECDALCNFGLAHAKSGHLDLAIKSLFRALRKARSRNDQKVLGAIMGNMSIVMRQAGRTFSAIRFAKKRLHKARTAEDGPAIATALAQIGALYEDLGDGDAARSCYTQQFEVATRGGYARLSQDAKQRLNRSRRWRPSWMVR